MTDREDSRTRFLRAAEQEFLATGYEGATVRRIATRAETSPATLGRFWGSKRELFVDILRRRFTPIQEPQSKLFDHLQLALEAGEPVTLRAVVRAFMDPFFHRGNSDDPDVHLGLEVVCRAIVDAAPEIQDIILELVGADAHRLMALLRATVPGLKEQDFFLAVSCVFSCYLYPLVLGRQMADRAGFDYSAVDWDRAAVLITEFLQGGLLAMANAATADTPATTRQ